jgi:AcrR family transcriptional regulator
MPHTRSPRTGTSRTTNPLAAQRKPWQSSGANEQLSPSDGAPRRGRPKNPARRAELLEAVARVLLEGGVLDASLRNIAAAIGVSPNALEHHFHSRANLFAEALAYLRDLDRRALLETLPAANDPAQLDVVLAAAWQRLSDPATRLGTLVFFETWVLALRNPDQAPGFTDHVVTDWLEGATALMARANVPPERQEALATLCVAALRGLVLDLVTMGEESRPRVDAAVAELGAFSRLVSSPANRASAPAD